MDERTLLDRPLAVSQINAMLRSLVKESFYNLCIEGEVSTFRPSANGHWYFRLKDERSQIDAVMFRSANAMASFIPRDGDLVLVKGSIDVYEARGTYQVIVQSIEHAGLGALLVQLEKRRQYYQSLGWFDDASKPPLPRFPRNIGVVTATTGAAIRDILDTTGRRAPSVDITIYPALVQGDQAAHSIASAIRQADELGLSDVLIVGRGGGSVEDLLPFSDDEVVKAIHECSIPVISAVGHEIDTSIADLVATRRAITPTDGAAIATEGYYELRTSLGPIMRQLTQLMSHKLVLASSSVPSMEYLGSIMERKVGSMEPESLEGIRTIVSQKTDALTLRLSYAFDGAVLAIHSRTSGYGDRLSRLSDECGTCAALLTSRVSQRMAGCMLEASSALERRMMDAQRSLDPLSASSLETVMGRRVQDAAMELEREWERATMAMARRFEAASSDLSRIWSACEALDPAGVLARGYAIVRDADGRIVHETGQVHPGQTIEIRLTDGSIAARVEDGGIG